MGILPKKDDLGCAWEWCGEHVPYPTAAPCFTFKQLLLVRSAAQAGFLNSSAHLTAHKPFESHSFADQTPSIPAAIHWGQVLPVHIAIHAICGQSVSI